MDKGKVSVIIPVYNAEKFLSQTIQSILNQTYENYEIILIDDCSTDNSKNIIEEFICKDSRIKLYELDNNSGAAVSRNKGLKVSEGQYIAFIDSDDLWKENKLEKQIKFMEQNNFGFTFTNYEMISENGEVLKASMKIPNKLDYKMLLKNTAIACSSVIIDRSIIGEFTMPNVRKGQDTATWLKILRHYQFAMLLDEVLGSYRLVENSISANKFGAIKRTWNTYRNIEKLSFIRASYYFLNYIFNAIVRRFFS
ncbi:glycosyltransferase family 2 protein [Marinilactibacillus psychrotolerans]|uniref:Glycosyl transferase n=1 Tax=Marinilactibacillus psychrotolerans TaxID=191770 RepID=A0AAV3WWE0_9LACT|nr:glycosyltransferase family 2 protein [Marinilactibacillus psychrotolerans]GEL68112.1 glycosyl transferase [Marinilactibacillus psychrotolerans]GEQ36553.1 glycosyl transferase [Marinilactibacillus psychrotolerans]SDD40278.1 teichuronic acid biosynthesis glycosyltransferase TuaG [Marinilactibacillus psychrotolerans]